MNDASEILKELLCSHPGVEHFVKDPLSLSCTHPICTDCVAESDDDIIECRACDEETEKDSIPEHPFTMATTLLKHFLSHLFVEIEKQAFENISKLENLTDTWSDTIDVHFQYVEEEFEIRVESMKSQLEELLEKFKIDLKRTKDGFKKELNDEIDSNCINVFKANFDFDELHKLIQNKEAQNEEQFYKFQDHLKSLKQTIKEFEENIGNFELTFKPSEEILTEENIGRVTFCRHSQKDDSNDARIETLKRTDYETIELKEEIKDICQLSNKTFLCLTAGSLRIYDIEFNIIKETKSYNGYLAEPVAIAVCSENRIYVTNKNAGIYIVDSSLNLSRFINCRFRTSLSNPGSICCKDEFTFIAERSTKKIDRHDREFNFIDSMALDYDPEYITMNDHSTIGVSGDDGVYFYDAQSKAIKAKYNYMRGRINESKSQFYVLSKCFFLKQIYVFNASGCLIETIENTTLPSCLTNIQIYFTDDEEKLLVNFQSELKLLKF